VKKDWRLQLHVLMVFVVFWSVGSIGAYGWDLIVLYPIFCFPGPGKSVFIQRILIDLIIQTAMVMR
jgi:hypothetical protein